MVTCTVGARGLFSKHMKGSISLEVRVAWVLADAPGVWRSLYAKPNIMGQNWRLAVFGTSMRRRASMRCRQTRAQTRTNVTPCFLLRAWLPERHACKSLAGDGLMRTPPLPRVFSDDWHYNFTQFCSPKPTTEGSSLQTRCWLRVKLDTLAHGDVWLQGLMELTRLNH